MRRPFLVCERHCRYYPTCVDTFDVWDRYHAKHGRPCPLEFFFATQTCPHFFPGERTDRLPEIEVR